MGSSPKSGSSSVGSRRAGASDGARGGRSRQSRTARITSGSWMAASSRSLPPQRGHANASAENTLWSSSAQDSLRARGRDGLRGCRPCVASLHAASLLIGLRASPRGSGSARSGAGFCGASGSSTYAPPGPGASPGPRSRLNSASRTQPAASLARARVDAFGRSQGSLEASGFGRFRWVTKCVGRVTQYPGSGGTAGDPVIDFAT